MEKRVDKMVEEMVLKTWNPIVWPIFMFFSARSTPLEYIPLIWNWQSEKMHWDLAATLGEVERPSVGHPTARRCDQELYLHYFALGRSETRHNACIPLQQAMQSPSLDVLEPFTQNFCTGVYIISVRGLILYLPNIHNSDARTKKSCRSLQQLPYLCKTCNT